MSCHAECRICNVQGTDLEIRDFTQPPPTAAGDTVTVSFSVWHCSTGWCGEKYFIACIYDTRNNQCVTSTADWVHILAGETIPVTLSVTMPAGGSFNGNISIVGGDWDFIQVGCAYSLPFSIQQYIPPGQPRYNCVGTSCQRNDGCTAGCYSDSNCGTGCSGGGPGTDTCVDPKMSILGACVPKQVVFLGFALAALYIFSKNK